MTDLEALLQQAIGPHRQTRNGWDFSAALIWPPRLEAFTDDAGTSWRLWLVLQEPGLAEGYQIAFDPEDREFALAQRHRISGWYEDFTAAVNGM